LKNRRHTTTPYEFFAIITKENQGAFNVVIGKITTKNIAVERDTRSVKRREQKIKRRVRYKRDRDRKNYRTSPRAIGRIKRIIL